MLELRPNCELCDRDLPPESPDARICTYECTFCASCVEETLENVCPNCGGGFEKRPVRPKTAIRSGAGLARHPASTKRVHTKLTRDDIVAFAQGVKTIAPEDR